MADSSTILPNNSLVGVQREIYVGLSPGTIGPPTQESLQQKAGNRPKQTAFLFNTSNRPVEDQIVMLVNPQNMKWSVPQRTTRSDVFGGTIIHKWKNMGESSADIPQLTLTMSTGLIFPVMAFSGATVNQSFITNSMKASIFYRFVEMVHEPAFTDTGEPNYIEIMTSTMIFPNLHIWFVLTGAFDFSETAQNPFQVEFSMSGLVAKSNPQLSNFSDLNSLFNSNIKEWQQAKRMGV